MKQRLSLLVLAVLVLAACTDQRTSDPPTTVATTTSSTSNTAETTTTTRAIETSTTAPDSTATTMPAPDVAISGDEENPVVEGPGRVSFALGEDAEILVSSSFSGELHLHGYDLFYDLVADEALTVAFTADIPGIFELEIEGSHTLVVEIEIVP